MNLDFYNPVKILSGPGCFSGFEGYGAFGRRALIVCGKNSARACGALGDAEKGLGAAGIGYKIFDKIEPNPMLSTVFEGGALAREFGAEFIIGIGGGSPLDAAKAVAAFAADGGLGPMDIYGPRRNPALPLLAVNTTAGTGSEVTQYSVLTVPAEENKRAFAGEDIFAKIAFLDPAYTYSLPMRQTAATGADALSHAVEGYFSKKANPVSDALAEKAIPMICAGLRAAAAGKPDEKTREELLYASTLAGLVISRTGTGFVHSTGYMLTVYHSASHGEANAYLLADFVEVQASAAPERAERVYALCGVNDAEGLYRLLAGNPAMPLDLKLTKEQIRAYADRTAGAKNVKNSVAEAERDDIYKILEKRLG